MTQLRSHLIFNGRYLAANPTGVHRVADEMILALDRFAGLNGNSDVLAHAIVAAPPTIRRRPMFATVALCIVGRLTGPLWEQISLPRFVGKRRLINLCNLAPIVRPGVVMIHDAQVYISPESYSMPFRLYYRLFQPLAARRSDRVLTVSAYSRDMLVKYKVAPANKITVVHNGVDHMLRLRSDPSILRQLGLERGGYAVALSNTQRHKNIAVLLRAFADPRLKAAKLVLVGSATAAEFAAQGHSVPDNVFFAGRVTDEAYRTLVEEAACMAFPSTTEGFGLPPLEAMILGCPAVVAPCGSLPEVCGDAATYVASDDTEGWARAISSFTSNWAFRKTTETASRTWASAFTWERSARALLEVLISLDAE